MYRKGGIDHWFVPGSLKNTDKPVRIVIADGSEITSTRTGTVMVNAVVGNSTLELTFKNVLYLPGTAANIFSVGQAEKLGNSFVLEQGLCNVYGKSGNLIFSIPKSGGVYRIRAAPSGILHAAIAREDKIRIWHERLAHCGAQALKESANGLTKGLPDGIKITDAQLDCVGCSYGKMHLRSHKPRNSSVYANGILDLIHSDVCGPLRYPSLGGAYYFVTFIDDFSRMIFIYLIKRKGAPFEKFKAFKAFVEKQTGKNVKALKSDNGGEYVNHKFASFCKEHGIKHETIASYTPQQNGVSERANRTLMEKTRTLLHSRGLSAKLWGEAINTVVYVNNRIFSSVHGATPMERWNGVKPSLKHLKVSDARLLS